jgi:hypothetical protein
VKLGVTAGWGRTGEGQDYYLAHGRPKQLWVRELTRDALRRLRATALPPAWAVVEATVAPRCQASTAQVRSLLEHLRAVPEFRRKQSLAYPLPGLLALIAMATFCGVVRSQRDLASFALTLSQAQLRALHGALGKISRAGEGMIKPPRAPRPRRRRRYQIAPEGGMGQSRLALS